MMWTKLGQIYKTKNKNKFLKTHAANPLAMHLEDDIFRIFYNGRDSKNRSSIGCVDIDINTQEIIKDYKDPILTPDKNTFYKDGISNGNLFYVNGERHIGFMAWQNDEDHWRGDIGVLNLETMQVRKLLGISEEDKVSLSYPFIMFEDGEYKMWYGSTIDWKSSNGEMIHVMKYATSKDCIEWELHGECLPYELNFRQAVSRPTVIKEDGYYYMYFSYRDNKEMKYRIGRAFSKDGKKFKHMLDNINIGSTWDGEMICYPFIFKHKESTYLLYNGNDHGKEGFGLAKL